MDTSQEWKLALGAGLRFDNVQKMRRSLEAAGAARSEAQQGAFSEETNIYNSSKSRLAYDQACHVLSSIREDAEPSSSHEDEAAAQTHDLQIGTYRDCQHLATGYLSEVYRSHAVALKIITANQDMEPHNPLREVKILKSISHGSIITLLDTAKDNDGRLILVFPFMPFTLANILSSGTLTTDVLLARFAELFSALTYLHDQGIIHRDVKPSNVLLKSSVGPLLLADFGTAWHPELSSSDEPANHKILEVGTGCYRAPETLFGNRSYDTSLDMWASGAMLVECLRPSHKTLFESRDVSQDGNQLGLILSIFKTLGTPSKKTWPEAVHFTTPPFEWYQEFPGHSWEELLPSASPDMRKLVSRMVCYESGRRITAKELGLYVEAQGVRG